LAHRRLSWCFWCLLVSTASAAMAPLVVPEARAAIRALRGGQGHRSQPAIEAEVT
jgi:hypothetical protein